MGGIILGRARIESSLLTGGGFDLPAGDVTGLEHEVGECIPASDLDERMRAAVDEAVHPLWGQIDVHAVSGVTHCRG